jgi:signal transduction histidine kinase
VAVTSVNNRVPTLPSKPQPAAPLTGATNSYQRLRTGVAVAIGLIGLALMLVHLVLAIDSRRYVFFGAMLTPNLVVDGSVPIGDNWVGLQAGLRLRDHILAINDQPLFETAGDYAAARTRFLEIVRSLQPGTPVTVTFQRPADQAVLDAGAEECTPPENGIATCTVRYDITRLPDNDFITFFLVPYIAGLIIFGIGAATFWLRRNHSPARLVAVLCVMLAVFMGGAFDANNTYQLNGIWLLSISFLGAPVAMIALIFPYRARWLTPVPALFLLPLALCAAVFIFALLRYLNPPTPWAYPAAWQSGIILAGVGVAFLAWMLQRQRRRATSMVVRDQCNTILIGLTITAAPIVLWGVNTLALNLTGETPLPFNTSIVLPFLVLPVITLAYAVLQYRSLDTDRIVSQGVTYSLLALGLVVGYFLMVFGFSLITREALVVTAASPFLIAVAIFVIAALFTPVRNRLQSQIDSIYFRQRTNYQERVEAFANSLTSLGETRQIADTFRAELDERLKPATLFIFTPEGDGKDYVAMGYPQPETDIRFAPDSPLIDYLKATAPDEPVYLERGRQWPVPLVAERARMGILRTMVITRLIGKAGLVGFVIFGAPQTRAGNYQYEDLRFLQSLTNQLALSLERTQALERLQVRVREQEVLSQVSQAVNFTIEYDDLLELINAQTTRVLPSTHFYITLKESNTDRLYHAFFLENEDRFGDKENRRWTMAYDLFSEVIRTESPLRVTDFAEEMKRRNAPIILEDLALKNWMAVPLSAGAKAFGVMSIGNIKGAPYTEEQMKVLNDIGTLAGTSLEKARLFAETNLRANQLSTLNTVSQKLASELDVDKLFQLITTSAVRIFNAEAGSLLMLTPDRRELEFKVVIGGSGSGLIGKRFPANRGLAGEAISSGQPAITNDAGNDTRWGGEIGSSSFVSESILTVPLISRDEAQGVLQVINKKNGSGFYKEDGELLATFAGQAAVALENARLFQSTDQALQQRVKELESLERIDTELNRSLDLQKVSEITIHWAITNTAATAGVLGVVEGEAPNQVLRITASYGYEAEDAPAGAEDKRWPLTGIVGRVMRTRQAETVPDVSIDPAYTRSLRGSLSQITIPMLSGREINAILILETNREPRLSLVDQAFAQRLAEHASIAIANAQYNAELTVANNSKSEFVSFVAHELKNPMTSIKGFAGAMFSGMTGEINDQQRNFLETILKNVDRLSTLVSDLNDVTRLQTNNMAMDFAPEAVLPLIEDTLRPLEQQIAAKGQQVTVDVPADLPLIQADKNRLLQVLTNLVSNAYKYTPAGGAITIRARRRDRNLDQKNRDLGPAVHVTIADTGMGISESDQKKLFTTYFRSTNPEALEQPGTGLGLTITREIIVKHGGLLWVESELGKGTQFHFIIPLAAEPVPTP